MRRDKDFQAVIVEGSGDRTHLGFARAVVSSSRAGSVTVCGDNGNEWLAQWNGTVSASFTLRSRTEVLADRSEGASGGDSSVLVERLPSRCLGCAGGGGNSGGGGVLQLCRNA